MRMRAMRADDDDQLTSDSVEGKTSRRGSLVTSRLPGGLATGINPRSKRRGSAVTFDLPDDSDEEEERIIRKSCGYRRMSAPELPPIADKSNSKGTRSSSGSGRERSGFYNRIKNGRLPRNHSEGSIKGTLARSPISQSSSSLNSIPPGTPVFLSSKTRSYCDTEKSTGSTTKLGTLFERKPAAGSSSPTRDSGSGYRSTSTDRGHSRSNFRSESEVNNNNGEIFPIEKFDNSRVLRRNYSENQLTDHLQKKKNTQLSNKILSVEKMDDLLKPKNMNGYNIAKLKRYNSTPTINRPNTTFGFPDRGGNEKLKSKDLHYSNDSVSESDRDYRIREWLRGVEFDAEEPPEQVIEYIDEPPQTDTAVHIVYNQD